MRKTIQVLTSILLLSSCTVQYIDPTGTYQMGNNPKNVREQTSGYSGQIQIKKISPEKIAMTFEVNKGAPSYQSGSFVDTLNYLKNQAIYTAPEWDSTCKITFDLDRKGITVKEETADYNSGCGFGHAVIADGFYERISNETPILTRPLTGEKLEE